MLLFPVSIVELLQLSQTTAQILLEQVNYRIPVQCETAASQSKQVASEAGQTSNKKEAQIVFSGVGRSNKLLNVAVTLGRCLLTS